MLGANEWESICFTVPDISFKVILRWMSSFDNERYLAKRMRSIQQFSYCRVNQTMG